MRKRHLAANFLFNRSLIYTITSAVSAMVEKRCWRRSGIKKNPFKSKLLPPRMSESLPSFNFCEWSMSALWTLFILWHLQACHNFSYREEAHKTNEISHKTLSISLLKANQLFLLKMSSLFFEKR